jgi:hypothetical protein
MLDSSSETFAFIRKKTANKYRKLQRPHNGGRYRPKKAEFLTSGSIVGGISFFISTLDGLI